MHLPSPKVLNRCLLALCLLWLHDAVAWGTLGHRITGTVAESLLTATAHRQIHVLLGDESLANAATFMDTQRAMLSERWPYADRWHYNNQPLCSHQLTPCPHGDCATKKIEEFRLLLADRRATRDERAMALRLLIHMLGDIHQPLHMADNADHGGNTVMVKLDDSGQVFNLHEVLDTLLIRELIGSQRSRDYAMSLTQRYQAHLRDWQHGTVADWAQQSHELAVTHAYGDLPGFACQHANQRTILLTERYLQNARQYLPEQLTRAGVRIAAVLNATLN